MRTAGLVGWIAVLAVWVSGAPAQEKAAQPDDTLSAVVAISAKIQPSARSASTLGTQRRGTGALIRDDHVLTIGTPRALLGIGSLVVPDADGPGTQSPGNMFVPIELLKPILSDLMANGRASGPARPWLGVNTDEFRGRLFVSRVSPDGPAERAGLKSGDIILSVGGEEVNSLRAQVRDVTVRSVDRIEYFRARPSY